MRRLNSKTASWSIRLVSFAGTLLFFWVQVHLLLTALHDDGKLLRNSLTIYNDTEVREQFTGILSSGLDLGSKAFGNSSGLGQLNQTISVFAQSGKLEGSALEGTLDSILELRADALKQFQAETEDQLKGVNFDLKPMLTGLAENAPKELKSLIPELKPSQLQIPLIDSQAVKFWRYGYQAASFFQTWGIWIAGGLLVAGIALSKNPVLNLAINLSVLSVALLTAPLLAELLAKLSDSSTIGIWSLLVAPLLGTFTTELIPWFIPIGIGAAVLALLFFIWSYQKHRRKRQEDRDLITASTFRQ